MGWFSRQRSTGNTGSISSTSSTSIKSSPNTSVPLLKPDVSGMAPKAHKSNLSKSAETELYSRAHKIEIPADRNLTPLVSQQPGVYLFIDVGIRVLSTPDAGRGHAFKIPANTFLSPNILCNLQGFEIFAEGEGRVLQISIDSFAGLGDELRDYLNQRLLEGDAAMVLAVMAEYRLLEKQAYQLGDRLHEVTLRKRSKFVESKLVVETLQKIPRLPVSTGELLGRLQDSDSSSSEVSDLVKQDPSLTGLLLRAINSPQYALAEPISDVNRAIVLLGYEGVFQLIMAAGFKHTLPDTGRFRASYEKAIELSQIAFSLSAVTGKGTPAVVSTIALLHDVGLLVSELLKKRFTDFAGLIADVDRSEFGGELMHVWGLPKIVTETIRAQRYPDVAPPEKLPEEVRDAIALLYIADLLHTYMVARKSPLAPLYLREYLHQLGWRDKSLDAIWKAKVVPHMRIRKAALPKSLRDL